jgi:hypothetical protein
MPPRLTCWLALLLGAAPPLSAQLTVQGDRNLNFGVVIQGVPTSVSPNDPVRSGELEFTAAIGKTIQIAFTLPNRLNGPAGATMPITFGATDGVAVGTAPTSVPVTFDPRTAHNFNLVTSARVLVFLGGRVSPAVGQRTGSYSNTITMTITVF